MSAPPSWSSKRPALNGHGILRSGGDAVSLQGRFSDGRSAPPHGLRQEDGGLVADKEPVATLEETVEDLRGKTCVGISEERPVLGRFHRLKLEPSKAFLERGVAEIGHRDPRATVFSHRRGKAAQQFIDRGAAKGLTTDVRDDRALVHAVIDNIAKEPPIVLVQEAVVAIIVPETRIAPVQVF